MPPCPPPPQKYYAAIPTFVFDKSEHCGRCIKVQGLERDSPDGWTVMKIVDSCASCKGRHDVDMSIDALEDATGYDWDRKVRRGWRGWRWRGWRQRWRRRRLSASARHAAAARPPWQAATPGHPPPSPPASLPPAPQDIGWKWASCGGDRRRSGRRMAEQEAEDDGELFHTEILVMPARN